MEWRLWGPRGATQVATPTPGHLCTSPRLCEIRLLVGAAYSRELLRSGDQSSRLQAAPTRSADSLLAARCSRGSDASRERPRPFVGAAYSRELLRFGATPAPLTAATPASNHWSASGYGASVSRDDSTAMWNRRAREPSRSRTSGAGSRASGLAQRCATLAQAPVERRKGARRRVDGEPGWLDVQRRPLTRASSRLRLAPERLTDEAGGLTRRRQSLSRLASLPQVDSHKWHPAIKSPAEGPKHPSAGRLHCYEACGPRPARITPGTGSAARADLVKRDDNSLRSPSRPWFRLAGRA